MNLILLELNEVNFDIVKKYIKRGYKLPAFEKIILDDLRHTESEKEYDHLEPWIQWPSVHIGVPYQNHNIFRLGDIINSKQEQIFEKVEKQGFTVGAVSPMNAKNNLENPKYFIPDPWTQTKTDGSFVSKAINKAVSQAVNDNSSSRITIKSLINLSVACFYLINPFKLFKLSFYAISTLNKPWRKAILLDKLLYEMHKSLFLYKKPNFSILFLNACAHIQHHYFFNSKVIGKDSPKNPKWYLDEYHDPLYEVLKSYDKKISDLLKFKNTELIIATGLSQVPYNKTKFYYRLRNHGNFLEALGLKFKKIFPRMTRDFLVEFYNVNDASKCYEDLSSIKLNNQLKLFDHIEQKGNELFITLTYPNEINKTDYFTINNKKIYIHKYVVFVAVKNGMHHSKGFVYFSEKIKKYAPPSDSHVSNIHKTILDYFVIS